MLIDTRRYERHSLAAHEQEFLCKLVSFAQFIQNTSYDKCQMIRVPTTVGLCASLAMADIILVSNWGTHQVAAQYSNLSLLKVNEYWRGKTAEVAGSRYRVYSSWLDYAIDLTDELTFFERTKYLPVLMAKNLDSQVEIMSSLQPDPTSYYGKIGTIIERFGLLEFDW